MPLIPQVKIKLGGNRGAGQSYIKFATAQLAILERQMSFQKLNEGSRVVSPWEGVTVWCWSKFGKKEVHIHVDQPVSVIVKEPSHPIILRELEVIKIPEFTYISLFASGNFQDGLGGSLVGKKMLNLNEVGSATPFTSASGPSIHYPETGEAVLQVKYLPGDYNIAVEGGEPVLMKGLSFSISIIKRDNGSMSTIVSVTQPLSISDKSIKVFPDILDVDVEVVGQPGKAQVTDELIQHKFEIPINTLAENSNACNATANLSEDKSVLYIYSWLYNDYKTNKESSLFVPIYEQPPVLGTTAPMSWGSVWIYDRVLVEGVITWVLRITGTLEVPHFMSGAFIDNTGKLFGFYSSVEEPAPGDPEGSVGVGNPITGGTSTMFLIPHAYEWQFANANDIGDVPIGTCMTDSTVRKFGLGHTSSTEYDAASRIVNEYYTVDLSTVTAENLGVTPITPIAAASTEYSCTGTAIVGPNTTHMNLEKVTELGDLSGLFSVPVDDTSWETWSSGRYGHNHTHDTWYQPSVKIMPFAWYWGDCPYPDGYDPADSSTWGIEKPWVWKTAEAVTLSWTSTLRDLGHHIADGGTYFSNWSFCTNLTMFDYTDNPGPDTAVSKSMIIRGSVYIPPIDDELAVAQVSNIFEDPYSNAACYTTNSVYSSDWTGTMDGIMSYGSDIIDTHRGIPISRQYSARRICHQDGYQAADFYESSSYFVENDPTSFDTLYPIKIPHSQPISSFMLYDQTAVIPLDFRGVYYEDANTGAKQWIVTLNGVDVTTNLLEVLNVTDENFYHLGLLF